MRTLSTRSGCILTLLLLLPLVGCDFKRITVRIDQFETREVQGLRFWRLDDASGTWLPEGHVLFSDVKEEDDVRWVNYTPVNLLGEAGHPLGAELLRDPEKPGTVVLDIFYEFAADGWFRVSTFNANGESPLSEESILL